MSKILIVDDEAQIRKLLRIYIEADSHEVEEVAGYEAAIEACDKRTPDLVVTDLVMPEKNGIDLILLLKDKYPHLPVVAISGGGGISGRYDYLEIADLVGASCVLNKPIEKQKLLSVISLALAV